MTKSRKQTGVMLEMITEEVELPGGRRATLDLIRHPGASAIVPFLSANEVLLIRQYRYAAGGISTRSRPENWIPANRLWTVRAESSKKRREAKPDGSNPSATS